MYSLPEDVCDIWDTFRTDLKSLSNFKSPRHVFNGKIPAKTQLRVVADAYEKAYGAVVYIRATLKDTRIIVRLFCSKSLEITRVMCSTYSC